MKFKRLGSTGLKVSEICLGAMTFGSRFFNIGVVDQQGANQMVNQAIEAGVNFFDTADVYSYGESEELLGKSLKQSGARRDAVIVATKVRSAMSDPAMNGSGDVNNVGLSRQHIMSACEASLRRLGMDYIDLYQVHGWDAATPMEETLRALDDLVRQGKVLYLGCSNWSGRHLTKSLYLAQANGWNRFVSLQAYYSLAGRDLEHELLPLCREEGLAVLPWSPLSGGFLTGKFRRDQQAPREARRALFDFPPIDQERGFDAVEALDAVAKETGTAIAQVALAWALAQPGVTSVIIGANRMAQLNENLRAADLKLSRTQLEKLSATTAPRALYPQWMMERQNAGR
ncbi:MAG TPA: aldo/keto reductase [Terriglobia bacterium]|nr:aldo/keto reductase [Terriglobia bacterium]HEX5483390.1 aldo/keto reductase [Terriglobia bacterium]